MNQDQKKFLLTILLLAVLLAGGYGIYRYLGAGQMSGGSLLQQSQEENPSGETTPEAGDSTQEEPPASEPTMAPDFTVYDGEGNSVSLSDFAGTPAVVNFWASWCGPCQSEMPFFDTMAQEYEGKVAFMMVNMTDGSRETIETAAEYIAEAGYTFPVYYDTEYSAVYAYGIRSLPTTILVGADGELLGGAIGVVSEDSLREALEEILAEESQAA